MKVSTKAYLFSCILPKLSAGLRIVLTPILDSPEPAQAPFQSSARELLQPLQETADRVSRQVEEFAKNLDQFNANRNSSDQELWQDAWRLLDKYKDITLHRKDQTASKSPRIKAPQKNRKSLGDNERQIQNLQLEADIWNLSSQILTTKSPQAISQAKAAQETIFSNLHRYSTNTEIWERFLDADVVAQEYECMLDWLQDTAEDNAPQIEDVVSEAANKAERGDGIWSAGLIYTKDAIKKQKRARAWPMPLEPGASGLETSHVREMDGEMLVTQLDPDAPTRQDASYQVPDEFHELAAWQVCWEVLRRGWTLEKVREWWHDRNETWRSVLLQNTDPSKDRKDTSPWLRLINLASNREFASRCRMLSDHKIGENNYEVAVYGILGGSYAASTVACKTFDDHLFCLINALLIERYENFLDAYVHKLQDPQLLEFTPNDAPVEQVQRCLKNLQVSSLTKDEAHDSHRYIESAIVGQDLTTFFVDTGRAAAQTAHMGGQSVSLFETLQEGPKNDLAQLTAQDQDSVRMVAHLQLVLRALGFLDGAYQETPEEMDNNIVNYIGFLERNSKYALLPLYASKLSAERIPRVLSPILVNLTEPAERELQVKLMKQYNIPYPHVIYTLCGYAMSRWTRDIEGLADARYAATITEYRNKIIRMKTGFMSEPVSDAETKAVIAHEWVRYMDAKSWGMAAWSVTTMYKNFLLYGKLSAAKMLSEHVNLADTSLEAVDINLSLAASMGEGLMNEGDMEMNGSDAEARPMQPLGATRWRKQQKDASTHPLARESTTRDTLASKSLVWAQLEQLVLALDTLDLWQDIADQVEQ